MCVSLPPFLLTPDPLAPCCCVTPLCCCSCSPSRAHCVRFRFRFRYIDFLNERRTLQFSEQALPPESLQRIGFGVERETLVERQPLEGRILAGIPSTEIFVLSNLMCPENFRATTVDVATDVKSEKPWNRRRECTLTEGRTMSPPKF